jgi:hypothetical protein
VVVKLLLLPDEHFDLRNAASLQATKTKQKGTVVSKKKAPSNDLWRARDMKRKREREKPCAEARARALSSKNPYPHRSRNNPSVISPRRAGRRGAAAAAAASVRSVEEEVTVHSQSFYLGLFNVDICTESQRAHQTSAGQSILSSSIWAGPSWCFTAN